MFDDDLYAYVDSTIIRCVVPYGPFVIFYQTVLTTKCKINDESELFRGFLKTEFSGVSGRKHDARLVDHKTICVLTCHSVNITTGRTKFFKKLSTKMNFPENNLCHGSITKIDFQQMRLTK